ncbi:unnamed protein product, partial [Arabidopsis halleri]
ESLTKKKRTGQGDKSEAVGSSRRRWISTRSRRKDMTHTEPPLPTSTTSLSLLSSRFHTQNNEETHRNRERERETTQTREVWFVCHGTMCPICFCSRPFVVGYSGPDSGPVLSDQTTDTFPYSL